MHTKKKTANQEISAWLATTGSDKPLQHSNPASLYLASLQGSEASRTTARSVMKQIAVLCDQTPDTFPWHRLDRATVLALMEKLKQKGLSDNTRNLYLSIIKGISREAMLHQQMSDHQFSLIEQIRAIKLQRLAVGRALHVDEIAKLIDHCLHDDGAAGVRDAALLGILFGHIYHHLWTTNALKAPKFVINWYNGDSAMGTALREKYKTISSDFEMEGQ